MRKDKLAQKVIAYYAAHAQEVHEDILHTQEVVSYTRLIAVGEGLSEERVEMLECAAWLHDIGCPRSIELYGNSSPANQQRVGREVALELLADEDAFSLSEKEWLAEVVGTHHQYKQAVAHQFVPLFEADLITNILSGYYNNEQAKQLFATVMKTETSRGLFESVTSI